MLPYVYFSKSNNTLFFSFLLKDDNEVSGPFLRNRGVARLPCYSIHSRVESNQQPLQKIRRKMKSKSKDTFQWMYFYSLLNMQNVELRYFYKLL